MKVYIKKYLAIFLLFVTVQSYAQIPILNSDISSAQTIYLDFDGETVTSPWWQSGSTFTCAPSGLTNPEIMSIFERVSEDYYPFNINVTTDPAQYASAPIAQRIRIIITPTSSWTSPVGGIAYTGSFTWGDNTPAFVFSDRLLGSIKQIAECCSHESGHTLGLVHQSLYNGSCTLVDTYNPGTGSGEIGWAPIMGNSYNRNFTLWHDGSTPYGCTNTQDALAVITTSTNGVTQRADEYGDIFSDFTLISPLPHSAGAYVAGGIQTNTDADMFAFCNTVEGSRHIVISPTNTGGGSTPNSGANLDIKLTLYDISQSVVAVYDPPGNLDIDIYTPSLGLGAYFLKVEGTGNANCSDYGSMGPYNLSIDLYYTEGDCVILIFGKNGNANTKQNKEMTKEESSALMPSLQYNITSRNLKVNSPGAYGYTIYSINGVQISKGQLRKGVNDIDFDRKTKGLYLIRYTNGLNQYTEKFVIQ